MFNGFAFKLRDQTLLLCSLTQLVIPTDEIVKVSSMLSDVMRVYTGDGRNPTMVFILMLHLYKLKEYTSLLLIRNLRSPFIIYLSQ